MTTMTLLNYVAQGDYRFLHDHIELDLTNQSVNISFWSVTSIRFQQLALGRLRARLENKTGLKWTATVTMHHYAGPVPRTGGVGITMLQDLMCIENITTDPSGDTWVGFPENTADAIIFRCSQIAKQYDELFAIVCNGVIGVSVSRKLALF